MMPSGLDPQILSERLHALEAENRRWKLISLLAFFLVVAAMAKGLLAQAPRPPQAQVQTVEAQSFVLKDAGGTIRGQLSMKGNTPGLELYDAAGRVTWSTSARIAQAR